MSKSGEDVSAMTGYRAVSFIAVLAKWYMGCLVVLYDSTPRPRAWHVVSCGGTDGIGTEYIILLCKLAAEKAYEWKRTPLA